MAYRLKDPEKEIHDASEGFTETPARSSKGFSYRQAFTVFFLLLQSLFIIRLWSRNLSHTTSNSHHEDFVQRKWHRNTSYMSLDHAYDGLWNETGQSALIFNDENDVVQITM
jgi:hypothetical protein